MIKLLLILLCHEAAALKLRAKPVSEAVGNVTLPSEDASSFTNPVGEQGARPLALKTATEAQSACTMKWGCAHIPIYMFNLCCKWCLKTDLWWKCTTLRKQHGWFGTRTRNAHVLKRVEVTGHSAWRVMVNYGPFGIVNAWHAITPKENDPDKTGHYKFRIIVGLCYDIMYSQASTIDGPSSEDLRNAVVMASRSMDIPVLLRRRNPFMEFIRDGKYAYLVFYRGYAGGNGRENIDFNDLQSPMNPNEDWTGGVTVFANGRERDIRALYPRGQTFLSLPIADSKCPRGCAMLLRVNIETMFDTRPEAMNTCRMWDRPGVTGPDGKWDGWETTTIKGR